jgi:hypothetical protein
MTDNDIVIVDNLRRDVDRDIVDTLRDADRRIRILEWWDILGLDSDKPAMDVKRMRLVEDDGVHLTSRAKDVLPFPCVLGCERTRASLKT